MNRNLRTASFYLLIIMVGLSLIQFFVARTAAPREISYNEFFNLVVNEQVATANQVGNVITGELRDGTAYRVTVPPGDEALIPLLRTKTQYVYRDPPAPPWWTTLLSYGLMFALFAGIWYFFMQQSQAGGNKVMSFGKSRAKMQSDVRRRITFKDVAGYDEVKEELDEVVQFLKNPGKFSAIGARIPKGVMLYGPPGTGKTWLARAVAGEAGVPFFSISGSDFVEMFVGVGASRVRDMFDQAKKSAPAIVFIDEIDAVGRQRGAGLGGGHDEREQTLNQLLVEMDGFEGNEGVIIMAATNRPDILDPALLRPGRFDRQITVGRPDVKEREAILGVHVRNKPLAPEVKLTVVAGLTPGFTAADLENLVNESALLAARQDRQTIGMLDLEEAVNRVIAGPKKKSRVISAHEKKVFAYHEAGHALSRYLTQDADPVHLVSIIPRGMAGGYVIALPTEDRFVMTRTEILNNVTYALSGRVAEQLVFNEISTGAQDDLDKSTRLVRRMIMEYGMSEELGPVTYGEKEEQVFLGRDISRHRNFSETVAHTIDREVRRIVDRSYHQAEELLKNNREKLDLIANTLLERETLRGEELNELLATGSLPPLAPA
ncbi:MAG: ATP-dependent zinc metalloprotease FtsH [Firmicutes bacterium]|nr:ATP-dependent zinc metalloprotease FtsH [Dethiobacter sp.]MBS3887750.1 ATP-dependent zinc metalloprotease FtsH [Bacillota bacterium]MBS4053903.1 ATP-dependent zinc metalloprotease FtsH [Thermaerobacter sp.]